jgi:hypothetical protein
MAAGMEVIVDKCVSGETAPGLSVYLNLCRLPLSSSRRPMRVLRPIVQILDLSVLDARKQLTLSDAIAPQFAGHNLPRYTCKSVSNHLKKLKIRPVRHWRRGYQFDPSL